MAGRLAWFLKEAWAKELVLTTSFAIGTLALLVPPPLSPYTKYAGMINRSTPYNYPVPLRDDGNMPDVPTHPQDPQGPSLQWLKNLRTLHLLPPPNKHAGFSWKKKKKKPY